MLKQIDPGCAYNSAFAYGACEYELLAGTRNGRPFARSDFSHVLTRARVNKLDHDHVGPNSKRKVNKQKRKNESYGRATCISALNSCKARDL